MKKIYLSDSTIKHLLRIAQSGEGNEPACSADRSGNDWIAICDELSLVRRDDKGYVQLSPKTFDWCVEKLSWAFETYWDEQQQEK